MPLPIQPARPLPTAAHGYSRRQEAARAPTAASHERPRHRQRDPWSSPYPAREKRNILPPPSGPGPPRAVACQPRVVARKPRRSGRFRRLGRATGSVRACAGQPLRPRDRSGVCLRHGLRSARFAVCLRQRAQPAAYAHARPVARQPFGRARPPRHALAAAPAPCALGHPRLRCPGRARRHASSPGSRRGHTRGPRPPGHRLTPLAPSLAPTPARVAEPAADAPERSPSAADAVTARQHPRRRPCPQPSPEQPQTRRWRRSCEPWPRPPRTT